MPTIGSLFAGIGGFDLGFERAGFKTLWQCEIDKAAQGVLRRHFPDAKLHSDVREVGAHNLEPVDVLTYGSPCQDLSISGKRAGLAGARSGLFHEAARVIRELRARYGKPDFAIWENVPGAFSSNGGADFSAVVQAMVNLGARDICWRVLDSRYFGVAQRRRRVFLVADFGGERAEQILFEPEGVCGNPPARRASRQEAAGGLGDRAAVGGEPEREVVGALTTRMLAMGSPEVDGGHYVPTSHGRQWPATLASTLNTAYGSKMGLEDQHALNGAPLFVPVALPLQEVGKRTGVSTTDVRAGIGIGQQDDPMFTLQATAQHGVAVGNVPRAAHLTLPFRPKADTFAAGGSIDADAKETDAAEALQDLLDQVGAKDFAEWAVGIAFSLQSPTVLQRDLHGAGLSSKAREKQEVEFNPCPRKAADAEGTMRELREAGCARRSPSGWRPHEQRSQQLAAHLSLLSQQGAQGAAFLRDLWRATQRAWVLRSSLSAIHQMGRSADGEGQSVLSSTSGDGSQPDEVVWCLRVLEAVSRQWVLRDARSTGSSGQAMTCRRLMPIETERLQGFPRNWTAEARFPDGTIKPQSDGPRYKQLGNAVTVNVAEWIARRLVAAVNSSAGG